MLTGKNGQVGYELQRTLQTVGEIFAVDVEDCDLGNTSAIVDLVEQVKPSLIVNPAAYTAVDRAESDRETAYAINSTAPKVLAAQANMRHIPIIHYSTDYVFDGTKVVPYDEEDAANPKSVYGSTKWQGEKNVRAMCAQHIILRTSWVYGMHGNNFLKTMLRLAQEKSELQVISDQYGAPTSASFLAESTALIAQQLLSGESSKFGTFHLVAGGETTWHGYATKILEIAKSKGVVLKIAPDQVKPIRTESYPLPAARPRNSRLSTKKIQDNWGISAMDWNVDLVQTAEALLDSLK